MSLERFKYCINPECSQRQNYYSESCCQACGYNLLINNRYWLLLPLRELNNSYLTEVFEVEDLHPRENGEMTKVMKILNKSHEKLEQLFEEEARALILLRHPGIPKVAPDGYFRLSLPNTSKELQCLVMEKIPGQNLERWREENNFISEEQAINWLQQIANILNCVHQAGLFHRDIKPSNIMVKPDESHGQLVLIDFGTVRNITPTYIEKVETRQVTQVHSWGYTPPEQDVGAAIPKSDFFALGRTMVYLITGIYPDRLVNPQSGKLIWRNRAPQISKWLADLIDELMAQLPQKRPKNVQEILERLERFERGRGGVTPPLKAKVCKELLGGLLGGSVVITSLVLGVRYVGWLEALELKAFDQTVRLLPDKGTDPRLLVITITKEDIQEQDQKTRQKSSSLSDATLAQLLQKLLPHQPRVVGLNVYRDFPVISQQAARAGLLRQNQRFIAVCKGGEFAAGDSGIAPPPEVPVERLGFSDIVVDRDRVVRRYLWYTDSNEQAGSLCPAQLSFSLQLALHYLAVEGIQPQPTPEGDLQLGNARLTRLASRAGGYQGIDNLGYQMLLNYRTRWNIAQTVTLASILKGKFDPNWVRDKIVIIGVTTADPSDNFYTPYNVSLRGVFLQAQMTSQILSAVLDKQPLLKVWSFWGDALWVWGWCLVAGVTACMVRGRITHAITHVTSLGTLTGICWVMLLQGIWVPLIPSALGLIITQIVVCYFKSWLQDRYEIDRVGSPTTRTESSSSFNTRL